VWIGLSGYNKNDPVKILEDALYLISAVLKYNDLNEILFYALWVIMKDPYPLNLRLRFLLELSIWFPNETGRKGF